jgi:hypothetical protein
VTATVEEVLADPVGLIVRLVSNVEKHLEPDRIRSVVCTLVRTRAGRRNLAQALHDDPSLLRTGKPPAPFRVAKLLMALHEAGAQDTALPRCGECGRPPLRRQPHRRPVGMLTLLRQTRRLRGLPPAAAGRQP